MLQRQNDLSARRLLIRCSLLFSSWLFWVNTILDEKRRVDLIIGLCLGCVNVASALQCYDCVSSGNTFCQDPFNANNITSNDKINVTDGGACIVCLITNVFDRFILISFDGRFFL